MTHVFCHVLFVAKTRKLKNSLTVCASSLLPPLKYHFLKIGARFRLLGGKSQPRFQWSPPEWEGDEGIKRFALSTDSALYQKLCNPNTIGECQFANTVTLDTNLPCSGRECRVDTLVVVQVSPGTFYEYIRSPCVQLSFYNKAKKVYAGAGPYLTNLDTRQYTHSMCANPRLEEASRVCCFNGIGQYSYKFEYHGERTNFATNEAQCIADGGSGELEKSCTFLHIAYIRVF